ncbi:glycosyltransferase [Ferruginibacter sp.]|uniref:glycosyltransferase family 2 protein n=1 Tax=Ferruginibacter sp. TaxID=1940288 RepID=UPI0019A685AE|nr:glycosyltransferase [Ferruginibacter sp.]MBC7629031.1 glycosyltransferase [Ferruginibacter sp.]
MKISVLLITYNHSNYINEAIDSIFMQENCFSTEIVCLDDSSTDSTFEILSKRLKDVQNCILVKNDLNIGITRNYQKGFSLCTGKYLFVLEGDDYWTDSKKISKQINFMESHPFHSMCFHPYTIQYGSSRVCKNGLVNVSNRLPDTFSINDLLLNEGLIGNFSVCCYRKKWLDSLPTDLYNYLSYDWIINMFMGHFGLLGRINEVMSVYRYADNAVWSTKPLQERLSEALGLIPIYNSLLEYKYNSLFMQKEVMLRNQISKCSRKKHYLKEWMPPILIKIIRKFTSTNV